MEKWYAYIRWGILGALTIGLLYEIVTKFIGTQTPELVSWGFPAWSVYVIAGAQLFGALGLYYHKTVRLALTVLTVTTIGAILTVAGKHASFATVTEYSLRLLWPSLYLLGTFALMYLKAKRKDDEEDRWGLI
jgi:hypothetical protein